MKYGCVSPTPEIEEMRRSTSESSDASFEIVSAETEDESHNKVSFFKPSVTFHDIFDVYPMDADVIARISLSDEFKISSDDVVIVVPLAWTTVDQAVCSSKLSGNYVRFDVNDLPKAPADQFYQLCYCATEAKNIVGVSAPFFFREVHEEELMEFQKEHNKEFWTFRSRFAVLTDLYWNSVEKNINVGPDNKSQNCDQNVLREKLSSCSDLKVKCEDIVELQTTSVPTDEKPVTSNDGNSSDSYRTSDDVESKLNSWNIADLSNSATGSSTKGTGRSPFTWQPRSENDLTEEQPLLKMFYAEKQKNLKYLEENMTYQNQETRYKAEIARLYRQLSEKNCEIRCAKDEIQKMREQENAVSARLVDQFETIKNLKEEHAAYKKSMENRLKTCAKEYGKVCLKLRQSTAVSRLD